MVGRDETYSSGDCYDGTVCEGESDMWGYRCFRVENCHLHEQYPIQHVG
jgi:hypothetical protein